MSARFRLFLAGLPLVMFAGFALAQGYRPSGTSGLTVPLSVGGAGTFSGVVSVGGLDGGGAVTDYLVTRAAGRVVLQTDGKLCVNGTACTGNIATGGGTGVQVGDSAGGALACTALTDNGTTKLRGGVTNDTTGANCSDNASAVCLWDSAGTAFANGGGLTTANLTGAGTLSLDGGINIGDSTGVPWAQIGPDGLGRFDGGTRLGPTGTTISASCDASGTLNFASANVATCSADLTIALGCATERSPVSLQVPNGAMVAGSMFQAWMSADGTVSIRHCCQAGVSCDPASGDFYVRAFVP